MTSLRRRQFHRKTAEIGRGQVGVARSGVVVELELVPPGLEIQQLARVVRIRICEIGRPIGVHRQSIREGNEDAGVRRGLGDVNRAEQRISP